MNQLIKDNIGLIYHQLKKFELTNNNDAFSYGLGGLYNAAKTFDDTKGYRFSTYASTCIYNGISTYLRSENTKILQITDYTDELEAVHPSSPFQKAFVTTIVDFIVLKCEQCAPGAKKRVLIAWVDSHFEATFQELADIAGCSNPYAYDVITEIRKELREKFDYNVRED